MKNSLCLCLLALWLLLGLHEPALAQGPNAAADADHGGRLKATYRGGLVTPPLPKPEFTLTDTSGARFDFKAGTNGYVTLLFFGYAHCTSVCPVQMGYLAGALRKMPREVVERFKVIFVTTDPAHDNPRLLRTWLNHFDKSFIGLTGSEAEVRAAQMAAKVPTSAGNPAEHAAFVLAYTKDNLGHVIYPAGITQADWLHDLPQLPREVWTDR
jgi:protein SCO1